MEANANRGQGRKSAVGGTPVASSMYTKVIPRHLRARTSSPQGASTAGVSPTCAEGATQPKSTSAAPQPAPLNLTCSGKSEPTFSPVTLLRQQNLGFSPVCKQVSVSYLSVTAELKDSGLLEPCRQRAERGQLGAEKQSDGERCSPKEPSHSVQRKSTDGQKDSSDSRSSTASGRSADQKTNAKKGSLHTEHGTDVVEEGATMESDKDDGYCALKTIAKPFERRGWKSERRRHKEDWCPSGLQQKRYQCSEGDVSPAGVVWQDIRGPRRGSSELTTQDGHQTLRPISVRDTPQMQKELKALSSSAPADHVFQNVGRTTMTLEESCQLVFPHRAKGPRHTGSNSQESVNEQTGTGLGNRETNGHTDSQKDEGEDKLSVTESVDSHFDAGPQRSALKNSETAKPEATPPNNRTNTVMTPASSSKGAQRKLTPEEKCTEETAQKQNPEDKDITSTSSQHTSDSLSSGEKDSRSLQHDTLIPQNSSSALSDEFQAVRILQSCSACLKLCRDVRLLHCFHLLCEQCIRFGEDDSLQCGFCGAEQTLPHGGVLLLRDLFPSLFDLLAAPDSACLLSPTDPAALHGSSSQVQSQDHQAEFRESDVCMTALLKTTEETGQADNTCVQGNVEVEKASSATSTASITTSTITPRTGPIPGTLECPDRLCSMESGVSQTKQTPGEKLTKANVRKQPQDVVTDSSDSDDVDSYSITSLSDSSDNANNEHDTRNPKNLSTCIENTAAIQHSGKDQTLTRQSRTCGACHAQADLQHACVTCGGIGLCAGCYTAHLTLPVTRNHELMELTLSRTPLSPLTLLSHHQPLCGFHGQDLALQCCTCAQLLCHRCVTPQHAGHEVRELGQLQHAGRKQFLTLKRGIKQHVLTARSSQRAVTQQLDKARTTRQNVRQSIHDCARRHFQRLTSQTQTLTRDVETCTQSVLQQLTSSDLDFWYVQRGGERLRCLLNVITEDTPRLTQLILHTTCQVGEVESVVFQSDLILEDHLAAGPTLGRVCTLATSVPDTSMKIHAVFQTPGEVNALAVTPYKEVVCVSFPAASCQVWHRHGALLVDVSRHVTEPSEVKVTPSGILVILGSDENQPTGGGKACVTFFSPSGSVLANVPLSSTLQHTHMDCPTHSRLLISDGENRTITMYSLDILADQPTLTILRRVSHSTLIDPRHVTITVTGHWLVNDQGYFMRVVSPEDHVTTVLTEDEPEAVLQPPRPTRQRCSRRMLNSVCCDTRGRMMAVDSGKNGLYFVTSCSVEGGERHFVLLQELKPSCHVTAMAVDPRNDEVVLGMSDGTVYIVSVGLDEVLMPADDSFVV
ncbi:hypothetical protein ACOMHN_018677 [Nucella lapillus]